MNNILKTHTCLELGLNFPEATSYSDMVFGPVKTSIPDGTLGEWFQRQVQPFDQSVFKNILTVNGLGISWPASIALTDRQIEVVQSTHLVESIFGKFVYLFATAGVIRFYDLMFQSINNYIHTLNLHSRTKTLVRLLLVGVYYMTFRALGYSSASTLIFAAISLLSKILPLKYSNNILQISKLSNTKEFILNNFIIKNLIEFSVRSMVALYAIMTLLAIPDRDARIMHCCPNDNPLDACQYGYMQFSVDRNRDLILIILETFALILGKMMIDLSTVLVRRKIFDGDLRDPMAWVMAPFKSIFKNYNANFSRITEQQKKINSQYSTENSTPQKKPMHSRNIDRSLSIDDTNADTNDYRGHGKEKDKPVLPKGKQKTRGVADENKMPKTDALNEQCKPTEISERIEIVVDDCTLIFQKLHGAAYENKNLWGVIIPGSLSTVQLQKYQGFLENGHIARNSNIRQLVGHGGGVFEMGSGMNARLLGRMYNPDVIYNGLQNHFPIEDALNLVQEIERNCGEDISLIIFLAQAKKHQDISNVGSRI